LHGLTGLSPGANAIFKISAGNREEFPFILLILSHKKQLKRIHSSSFTALAIIEQN
jgi:hypothetical protein